MPEALNVDQLKAKALEIRKLIIEITTEAGSGHPSSSLSACDMVTALYFGGFMKIGAHTAPKPLWTNPILVNNRLIVASSTGEVAALNAKTGEVERKIQVGAPVLIGPISAGNLIYVVTDNAQLIALR